MPPYRNHRQTEQMREQMPKHFFVADEIKKHPDKENKTIVLVIDKQGKSADVILPAGASLEVNNEIKGMSKQRIQSALEKSGIENVRFIIRTVRWATVPMTVTSPKSR